MVLNRIRKLLEHSKLWTTQPSSIHPYCTLRACPDIIGTAYETLNTAKKQLAEMINGHQGNPVVVGPWNSTTVTEVQVGPVCSFDSTRLFCMASNVQQAVGCLAVSIAQRTEHMINKNGLNIPQLFSRRPEVFIEASLRGCALAAQVIPPLTGRMNCAAGYDWAAPAAQASAGLKSSISYLVKLMSVNMLVSSTVLAKIGEPQSEELRNLYTELQKRNFSKLKTTEPFSFAGIIHYIEERIEKWKSGRCESIRSYGS